MDRALAAKHGSDLDVLRRCVGLRVVGLARSQYIFDGKPDTVGDGELELRFEGGPTLVLTTAADGESVEADERGLRIPDSFALDNGSICAWKRVELSGDPYTSFLKKPLLSVDALVDHRHDIDHRALTGWVLHFGHGILSYVNEGDEGRIGTAVPAPSGAATTTMEEVGRAETAG